MPDVSSDERGRRIFAIQKEKAVESAVEKIRQSLGLRWSIFSQHEIATLKYILGEAWISVDRETWEQSSFTRLTSHDVEEIVRIGTEVQNKKIREEKAVSEICTILKGSA
jgi:hypothetical protein